MAVRNLLNGIIEMVTQLQAGSEPKIKSLNDEWSNRLQAVLPLYCIATAEDGSVKTGGFSHQT